MRVAMVPQSGTANPYVTLLRNALSGATVDVVGLSTRTALASPPAILHYHWPQNVVARRSLAGGLKNAATTLLRIDWLRSRGTRLVWTVHNLQSHTSRNRRVENLFMAQFTRRIDGVIFMDVSLREEALRRFPRLAIKPWVSIPHGVYGIARSKDSKLQYRRRFALPEEGPLVGFIGDVHPYKGLAASLDAFEGGRADRPALFIAGAFSDETEGAVVKQRLQSLRSAGARITLIERRLGDKEMVEAIRACDALLLPYLAGSNSGLAILSLEAEVPVICSQLPMFKSMQAEMGRYWVRTVAQWTPATLAETMAVVPGQSDEDLWRLFVEERQWPNVAARTRDFYRQLRDVGR
jgi:beta-1,4-mannosyltransferase